MHTPQGHRPGRKNPILRTLALSLACSVSLGSYAADGDLDPSFGTNGVRVVGFNLGGNLADNPNDLVVDRSGNIVVVGKASRSGGGTDAMAFRLTPAGNLDPAFANGGKFRYVPSDGFVRSANAVIPVTGGGLVIAGTRAIVDSDGFALRLSGTGAFLGEKFPPGASTLVSGFDNIAATADGIVLSGFQADGQNREWLLHRYSLATNDFIGGLNSKWLGGGSDSAMSVLYAPGSGLSAANRIVFGGTEDFGAQADNLLIGSVEATGFADYKNSVIAVDVTGTNNDDKLASLYLDPQGRVLVLGTVSADANGVDTDIFLSRKKVVSSEAQALSPDVTFSPATQYSRRTDFVPGGRSIGAGVAVARDGSIFVLGTHVSGAAGNYSDIAISKYDANGTGSDTSFGVNGVVLLDLATGTTGTDEGVAIEVLPDGNLIVLAKSEMANAGTDPVVVKVKNTLRSDVSVQLGNPLPGSEVKFLTSAAGSVHAFVNNAGPGPAKGVQVKVTLPAGVQYEGVTIEGEAPFPTCSAPPSDPAIPTEVTCSIAEIPALSSGANVTESFQVHFSADEPASYWATMQASSATPDPTLPNSESEILRAIDAAALKSFEAGPDGKASPGEEIQYRFAVSGAPSIPVNFIDSIPAGTTYVAGSAYGLDAQFDAGNGWVTWNLPPSFAGTTEVGFKVKVAPDYAGQLIDNTHFAFGFPACTTVPCTSTPATTILATSADLTATLTSPLRVVQGGQLSYQLSIANAGPADATNIVASMALPASVSNVVASGAGWECGVQGAHQVTCTRITMPVGGSGAISITANAPSFPTTVAVLCDADALQDDPTPAGANCAGSTEVTDVSAIKSVNAGADGLAAEGEKLAYKIVVTAGSSQSVKRGKAGGTGIVVMDPIPAGTSYVPNSASTTLGTASFNASANRVEWVIPEPFVGPVELGFSAQVASPLNLSSIDNTHLVYGQAACGAPPCVSTPTLFVQPGTCALQGGDGDSDGICTPVDNCPVLYNPEQKDTDADGQGDACDPDDDNDGLDDPVDPCSLDPWNGCVPPPDCTTQGGDTDGDGICDDTDVDDDNDGLNDPDDPCPKDPLNGCVPPPDCSTQGGDTDGDGICDDTDIDDDNDGLNDPVDPCPKDPMNGCVPPPNCDAQGGDTDGDGICNANDPDDDNDGLADPVDPCPLDPMNQCVPPPNCDASGGDTDGDGICDNADEDDDNDGLVDPLDPCPKDKMNTCVPPPDCSQKGGDTDGDGICDESDVDDDNDGLVDPVDPCPKDPMNACVLPPDCSLQGGDTDGDGICDDSDVDDDNDGLDDPLDPCPKDPTNQCNGCPVAGCSDDLFKNGFENP